jgi:hypothetical protein
LLAPFCPVVRLARWFVLVTSWQPRCLPWWSYLAFACVGCHVMRPCLVWAKDRNVMEGLGSSWSELFFANWKVKRSEKF